MRPASTKTQDEITREWGKIAKLRADQIEEGKDLSYNFILVPCIFELCGQSDFAAVVDVGCGSGFLTKKLSKKAQRVVGIDMSQDNVNIAKERYSNTGNIEFMKTTIEDYAFGFKGPYFTLAVANMSLMTTLHLDSVLEAIASLLKSEAHFVLTITHPCFWPLYWGYSFEDWFDYKKELPIEAIFKISLETSSNLVTTHVHRPMAQYVSELSKAGFIIDQISEPMPTKDIEWKYPKKWEYPRFLGIHCIKA